MKAIVIMELPEATVFGAFEDTSTATRWWSFLYREAYYYSSESFIERSDYYEEEEDEEDFPYNDDFADWIRYTTDGGDASLSGALIGRLMFV